MRMIAVETAQTPIDPRKYSQYPPHVSMKTSPLAKTAPVAGNHTSEKRNLRFANMPPLWRIFRLRATLSEGEKCV